MFKPYAVLYGNKSHVNMAIPRRKCLLIGRVEQNNSILRGHFVMKTDGWSDNRFETYVNTEGWK
jgi:hypothetical protein